MASNLPPARPIGNVKRHGTVHPRQAASPSPRDRILSERKPRKTAPRALDFCECANLQMALSRCYERDRTCAGGWIAASLLGDTLTNDELAGLVDI